MTFKKFGGTGREKGHEKRIPRNQKRLKQTPTRRKKCKRIRFWSGGGPVFPIETRGQNNYKTEGGNPRRPGGEIINVPKKGERICGGKPGKDKLRGETEGQFFFFALPKEAEALKKRHRPRGSKRIPHVKT